MIPKDFSVILRFALCDLGFVLRRKPRLAVSMQPGGWDCRRPERKAIDLTRRSERLTAAGWGLGGWGGENQPCCWRRGGFSKIQVTYLCEALKCPLGNISIKEMYLFQQLMIFSKGIPHFCAIRNQKKVYPLTMTRRLLDIAVVT